MNTLTNNQEKLIDLAYKRSVATLQAQAAIAAASDQRALVFSTLSVAAATLVFGALNRPSADISAAGAAVLFCISALASAVSAVPGKLHGSTSRYTELSELIQQDHAFANVLVGICSNNDKDLEENEKSAVWRSHAYRFSVFVFLIGVVWSLVSFAIVDTRS